MTTQAPFSRDDARELPTVVTTAGAFVGGGELGELIRTFDWGATPLGPMVSWSPALRMMVRFLVGNRFPMLLWWGPEYVSIYNDPYRPVLGAKHPDALGKPVREVWSEIWQVLKPLIDTPYQGGPSTWNDDIELHIKRHGYLEESHFTIAYSPVPDDTAPNGIGGVLATVVEITEKVVGERRLRLLRDLGARTADSESAEEACVRAAETLGAYPKDTPFALLYLVDADGTSARLAGSGGVAVEPALAPERVPLVGALPWPFLEAQRTPGGARVRGLGERFRAVPSGPLSEPPKEALVLGLPSSKLGAPAGFLVVGLSARLALDETYRDFLDLVGARIGAAIASARALEEERRRAEALAELDRAKTAFFSNVSHEFRTPLTLLLGPVADGLVDAAEPLPPAQRARQELVLRNGLRLQKLVNSLLDFARIEAGRTEASFVEVELGLLTAELASTFRSAIEAAGLRLVVDCSSHELRAFVDREMWEKIVLNLLSNALKFTFEGEIRVALHDAGERLELSVSDTGVGIEETLLPQVFERFYRVKNARSRTHEGTGIGLALVRELVALHGGEVSVASTPHRGTTFRVALPRGSAHLPSDRLGPPRDVPSTDLGNRPFVEEAQRWLTSEEPRSEHGAAGRARVLVVDDNADMREYVCALLAPSYAVASASDGRVALERIQQHPPDLVITDVMMPVLDGFGLVAALREGDATRTLPIIMLSARAGEEASAEGLGAGVNDYLVKPFTARELLARVGAQLEVARVRRAAELELRRRDQSKDEFLAMLAHELRNPLAPLRNGLELLRLSTANAVSSERVQALMEQQLSHLVRLVDDLLDVSRISRGKIELRRERVDLAAMVQGVVETTQPLIARVGHELVVDVPSEALPLDADPVRLSQVLANLLNNAAKYTRNPGLIALSVRREGTNAVVSVKDTGVGISRDLLARVFDLFMQVESGTGTQGGLGIGLTLVKSVVELHGGSVEARSDGAGQGSEFIVRLPLASGQEAPEDAVQNDPARALTQRVLVVDDNEDAAETLGMLLELLGAESLVVHHGQAALEALKSFRPSAVLLDIGLPGMDGHQVARRMRAEPEGRDVTLIALTGWGQAEDRRRSKEAGIDHHLVKPVDLATLHRALGAT